MASIDCKGNPEVVVIEISGASTKDMTGWKVSDDGQGHTFNFPNGFLLRPGSSVKLVERGAVRKAEADITTPLETGTRSGSGPRPGYWSGG